MVLGALRRIWGGTGTSAVAAADLPENRSFDEAPVPKPPYTRIVDKNGDEIIGRKPNGSDFLARPPVHYEYGGTIPRYNPDEHATLQDKMGAAMEYAARDYRNRKNMDKAVFLLSQTDDGRRLLHKAERNGFKFVFDHDRLKERNAAGLCDYTNKVIPITEGRSPFGVALTLKHELQHMEDIENGVTYSSDCTLLSSTMAERGLEANARVSESILASELYLGKPDGPDNQFRTSSVFAHFFHSKPAVAEVAFANLDAARKGDWKSFALPVFKAYQRMFRTLDYYDDGLADHYSKPLQQVIDKKPTPSLGTYASRQTWEQDQQGLKERITIKGGTTFLPDESELDLTSPEYTKISTSARTRLANMLDKVKDLVPTEIDTAITNLSSPERKHQDEKAITTPFTNYGAAEPFNAIQRPDRHDQHLVGGKTQYADTTRIFQEHYNQYNMYESELDRISFAIESIAHQGRSNMYGVVRDLVDAGMRVPIAALPFEYVMRTLCANVKYTAETGKIAFNDADMELIRHWKKMSDEGLDPVYGTAELAQTSHAFNQDSLHHFNGYLKPFFDKLEADRNEKAATETPSTHIA